MLNLIVEAPLRNATVGLSFQVTGVATAGTKFEPEAVVAVTWQTDQSPPSVILGASGKSPVTFRTTATVAGPGQHLLTVTATNDAVPKPETIVRTVPVFVAPDVLTLTITSPVDQQQVVSPIPVEGTATAVGNTVVEVTTAYDGQSPTPVPGFLPAQIAPFATTLVEGGSGQHRVTVTAIDEHGQSVEKTVDFALAVETTGQLTFVKAADHVQQGLDFATFGIVTADGGVPMDFILWLGHRFGAPNATAPDWIIRAAQLAMLRDALASKLQVVITHLPGSKDASAITVRAPT